MGLYLFILFLRSAFSCFPKRSAALTTDFFVLLTLNKSKIYLLRVLFDITTCFVDHFPELLQIVLLMRYQIFKSIIHVNLFEILIWSGFLLFSFIKSCSCQKHSISLLITLF